MITIGLLWHSLSSDNLGVCALTESQMAICLAAAKRTRVDIEFIILGTQGIREPAAEYSPVIKECGLSLKKMVLGKSTILRAFKACDIVFDIGEGDSFSDMYGFKRYLSLLVSKIIVLNRGIPLVLSPQTIGPFDGWFARKMSVAVMKRCTRVFSRDDISAEYIATLGITANTQKFLDLAFRLPFQKQSNKSKNVIKIGVNVSGLLFNGGYTGSNQFGLKLNYPLLVRRLLEFWAKEPANEVWLIPHVITDYGHCEDDRTVIDILHREFPETLKAPDFWAPSEAKSFISGMDFVTGARMHACIAAFSSGVPVVPVSYSRKFNGLFQSLEYPWLADGKMMTTDEAFSIICEGFRRRVELAKQVVNGNKAASLILNSYEDYIVEVLSAIRDMGGRNA